MPGGLAQHKALEKRCDDLWREIVLNKARPDMRCCRCGRPMTIPQPMHGVGRGIPQTRHEPDNGLPGCVACHRLIDENPIEKAALFVAKIGEERWERLGILARGGYKVDLSIVYVALLAQVEAERRAWGVT